MAKEEFDSEISVFMPVYNGERYLRKTIESVLAQTFRNFELVCVDDSSTDGSYEILKEYSAKDNRVRVFQKPNEGMVPPSWNYVLPYLRGKSITYLSQDDFYSDDNLESLYKRQLETQADCVLPDMVWYHEGKSDNKIIIGVNGDREKIISNKEAVALSLVWQIHGFGLWRSEIFKNRSFRVDAFDSDELFIRESFLHCNKVAFCKGVFYYRRDNDQAITKTFDAKNYYSVLTRFRIYELLKNNQFEEKVVNFGFITVVYFLFLNFRYSCLRRKDISVDEFRKARLMFYDVYKELEVKRLLNCAVQEKGIKRIKYFLVYLVFWNYRVFKGSMFFVYIWDKVRLQFGIYNVDTNSGIRW